MAMQFSLKKGLHVPISGTPAQEILEGPPTLRVGLLGDDYIGLKPTMLVHVGDRVKCGEPVFADKRTQGVVFTAPANGVVEAIHRGEKRRFESLVIRVEGDESIVFEVEENVAKVPREELREQLVESGLWTSFRTRPFNRIPSPDSEPHSIFVTAIDTQPLAADPEVVLRDQLDPFKTGLRAIGRLTTSKMIVCTGPGSVVESIELPDMLHAVFQGPHPAGLPGTHIHFIDPVGPKKTVWFIGYQDVIAIGHFFMTGRLNPNRIVAFGGPVVSKPALYRTRLGADLARFVEGSITSNNARVISGSVLSGRKVQGHHCFLGRYHAQVSALEEGNTREFLGWQKPGRDRFSVTKAFLGGWLKPRQYRFDTNLNGGHRAMVPIGTYEQVVPLDVLPTQLLRTLLIGDTEQAQALGCLELDEEDLALCTFVCPGKYDYGQVLRENLNRIEKEG